LLRRGRAAALVPVPTEPCTDDLNAVGIKDRCERANEARIGEGRKSILTTTITTATSTPAPAPTMSHNGFELTAELAVVGAERLIIVGVGVGEAEVGVGEAEVGVGEAEAAVGVVLGQAVGTNVHSGA
jgi:hypothetical protein